MRESFFRNVFVFAIFAAMLNFVSSGESFEFANDETNPVAKNVEVVVEQKVESKTDAAAVGESQPASTEKRLHL